MSDALEGRVAIVTGASRGIGRALADALAEAGMDVALFARSEEALEETAAAVEAAGGRALAYPIDLSTPAAMVPALATVRKVLGRIDVVVNNAGVYGTRGPAQDAELAMWDTVLDVNLRAMMHLTRHALDDIVRSPAGAVVNIASIAGKMTMGNGAAYTTSKHGVVGFSGALFEDLRERGVKVCAICPGFVNTDMVGSRGLDAAKMIQPEDIARTVLFVLNFPTTGCPTEIVLRPQRTPYTS